MSVRTYKDEIHGKNTVKSIEGACIAKTTHVNRKFNTSMEKKIERIWFDSKKLGWDFNNFVVCLVEVLIVVQQREKASAGLELAPRRKRQ
jgi:hypothetical protein